MKFLKYKKDDGIKVTENIERRFIHCEKIMTVVVDFSGGPATQPDPYHSHEHEQTTYIADGEVLFFVEGAEPKRLIKGDLVAIASNEPHAIQLLRGCFDLLTKLFESYFCSEFCYGNPSLAS